MILQIVVVYWPPAQVIFNTTPLQAVDWLAAILVASSVLLFDESRKWLLRLWRGNKGIIR